MQTREAAVMTIEAFLLIEQPRQRLSHWTTALAALDSPLAPRVHAIVAYYDPTCDQALLNLQYEPSTLGDKRLGFVVDVALLAEVGMVQPAELSEGERARFLAARLSRCTIRVTQQRSAVSALTELVRRIKDERSPQAPKPPPLPAAAKSVAPRGDTADPVMLVKAKGTRDNLTKLEKPVEDVLSTPTSRHVIPRVVRHATVEMPPEAAQKLVSSTRDQRRDDSDEDRITSPMDLARLQELASAVDTKKPHTHVRAPSPSSEPYMPTEQRQPDTIYARYLRGGKWVPVRIGALSLKGAALLTGALPRLHDRVDVALSFGSHRALVRGAVAKVSSVRESSLTGAATFSVSFDLDDASRKQLTGLLVAARDAKVTIKPPPPRATRRFPVEWQVALGTLKGAVKAIALDVSTGGMFVRTQTNLDLDATLNFSVVLDDGSAPIAGRAKVIRRITEAEARTCGLAAGFGLGITEMSEADRMRWLGFLARIERRAEKRVLIGAEPARLAELQAGLASLGYAVVGGTDPGTLVQLANTDARPADAVLIDANWLQNDPSTSLVESLFSARNVPCVTMHGEVRRARQAIDRLLEVVV